MPHTKAQRHQDEDGELCVLGISLENEPVLPAISPEEQAGTLPPVDEQGWPVGFFEATSGQWQGTPLVRELPTSYDVREELD